MNRTDRLVAMLLELQARGTVRAEDLAGQFEISVRTVYRDMDALAQGGVPLVATPGTGYRLMEGYFLPPLAFTASEAALLVLGGEFVKQRVDNELRSSAATALSKLTGVLPQERRDEVTRWQSELMFFSSTRDEDPRLGKLRSAIRERRVVRLLYHAFRRAGPEERDLEPVSLIYFAQRWTVAGYCRLREGPRLFRLDRIDRLDILSERFQVSERHTIPTPSDEWKTEAPEACVRFDPSVERWVRERQPFSLVREEHDAQGPLFVYAVRKEDDLLRWLLAWGAAVEVVSPPTLRARLAAESWAMFSRHATAPDIKVARAPVHAGVEV